MKAAFINEIQPNRLWDAFSEKTRARIGEKLEVLDGVLYPEDFESRKEELLQVECLFSTWGLPALTAQQLETYFPNLKAVFYAAGSVQYFARPFLSRGVRVVSAWQANGIPVAEYTVSQIVLAGKGYFQAARMASAGHYAEAQAYAGTFPANFGTRVGIIGAGTIGARVIAMLQAYRFDVVVFDPFLSEVRAAELGAKKVGLEELFSTCQTISNHLANNEQTRGMLNYRLFSRMKDNATFLNTGRGAQVVEADLVRALRERPNRTAVLDVTDPEPPQIGHPFYEMDNVVLTPHIAGSMNNEIARMGEFMADECERFLLGKPLLYEVTLPMLDTMA